MLEFIKPSPFPLLIHTAQSFWPLYARINGSKLILRITSADKQRLKALKNQRALLCPNHSAHDDPSVLFGVSSVLNEQFAFLTAREIFKGYPSISAMWLQWLGCYSVVRSSADLESYRATLDLLIKETSKIVIFPEGEITHQNMYVADLESGPEHTAIAAAALLRASGKDEPVWLIPVGLLYRYTRSAYQKIETLLSHVEDGLALKRPSCRCVPHRLKQCFNALLHQMAATHGWSVPATASLEDKRDRIIEHTLSAVADGEKIELAGRMPPIAHIHILRNQLNERRFAQKRDNIDEKRRSYYRSLKSITNLFAVGEHSFDHSLTQEEVGELLSILEYEVFRTLSIQTGRNAHVSIGKPIDAREFLPEFAKNKHAATTSSKIRLKDSLTRLIAEESLKYPSKSLFPLCTDCAVPG